MKTTLVRIFTLIYQYVTAFIVVASPLFFIPTTIFSPDVSYYLAIITAAAIALTAYVLQALLTRTWHTLSRFEMIGYSAFSLAVVASSLLSRDPKITFFGDGINAFVAASLLALPAIMYLVRTLPEAFRDFLKRVLMLVLAVSSLFFIFALMVQGALGATFAKVFLGFTSVLSLAAYIGVFVIALIIYIRRSSHHYKYKIPIATTALVFIGILLTIGYQGDVRPNVSSSLDVASKVFVSEGLFGIGAGDYARAWQLYRPQTVIASPYFSVDFNQASGTLTTFLGTIGVVGVLTFLFLVVGSCIITARLYFRAMEAREHRILGVIALTLLYFAVISVVVPFTYSMLVLWMVIAGFGIAKAPVFSESQSKKIAFLLIPLAVVLIANSVMTIQKTRAFLVFSAAQTELNQKGPTDEAEALLTRAATIYPYDGFYRAMVEYAIARQRVLVATTTLSQDALREEYLNRSKYAVDMGLEAVKLSPSNYQNYVSLGRAYELAIPFDKENGYARAKSSYGEAARLYPDNPFLYIISARLEASAGSREGVRTSLTEALKKKQNFADALYLMSQLEASEQKVDEALTYAVEAARAAPNDPSVFVQAGLLFYAKQDFVNAIAALQRALQLDQNNQNIAYFLALSLRDYGRSDLAKVIGVELLNRNPGNADLEAFLKTVEPKATSTPATKK